MGENRTAVHTNCVMKAKLPVDPDILFLIRRSYQWLFPFFNEGVATSGHSLFNEGVATSGHSLFNEGVATGGYSLFNEGVATSGHSLFNEGVATGG